MLKKKKLLLSLSFLFLFIEFVLGVLIQTTPTPNKIQYLSIILACLCCFIFFEKSKSYIFTQTALLFTVCADYFLVHLQPMNQLCGMIFFSGVQISYFLRIYFEEERIKIRKIHLIARISFSVVILIVTCLVLGKNADALALISMFYYANLILNLVFAFANFKNSQILAIGLVFFLLCDTFIGLSNIGPYISISENSFLYKILFPGLDMAWLFYVPSQMLLAVSLLPNRIKKESV